MEGEETEYQAILSFWAVRRAHDGPGPAWDGDGDLGGAPQLLGWSCLLEQVQLSVVRTSDQRGRVYREEQPEHLLQPTAGTYQHLPWVMIYEVMGALTQVPVTKAADSARHWPLNRLVKASRHHWPSVVVWAAGGGLGGLVLGRGRGVRCGLWKSEIPSQKFLHSRNRT